MSFALIEPPRISELDAQHVGEKVSREAGGEREEVRRTSEDFSPTQNPFSRTSSDRICRAADSSTPFSCALNTREAMFDFPCVLDRATSYSLFALAMETC
jgi:hypothetical protein